MAFLLIIAGVLLLLGGGEGLVKASIDISVRLKISMLVVGMTVVSFATSAPELLVSLKAAIENHVDLSFGNVIGSNIANIALILGLTAMVFPLKVSNRTIKVDFWIMLLVSLILLLFLLDGALVFWEALILFTLLVLYNVLQIRASRKLHRFNEDVENVKPLHPLLTIAYLVGGVAALRFGSEFLIKGSIILASSWGVSDRVIGVTIVSVGTSLPELAASLVAAFRGRQDISLGNLIGSNIFNILAVLGITGLILDLPVSSKALLHFDFPWLIGITLVIYPFIAFWGRGSISRLQGFILFMLYGFYVLGVFLK